MATKNPRQTNQITRAIEIAGLAEIAKACGVTYQAVRKWETAGRLPRTEWTGETHHANAIEHVTAGQVTKQQLLNLAAA